MMKSQQLKQIKKLFHRYRKLKLVYLFGSRARVDAGPISDYDFALYLDDKDKHRLLDLKLEIQEKLCRLLKTDKVDVVILNALESPELKYNVISEGKLIFEREPFKVRIEPKILNEYFDFKKLLLKYKLTRV